MYKNYVVRLGFLILLFSIAQCKQQPRLVLKNHSEDPFKSSIVKSQIFKIDSKSDTVLTGKSGTILIFQQGSFIDSYNNIVTEKIDIELSEALALDDMLLSNLTTKSGDQLLETDGMIYLNATSEGEQLFVNPEKPVYVEIPTPNRKTGMSVYEGIRDQNGNMNWINPIPIENHLIAVDIFSLDFLPPGFVETLEKEMPFLGYKTMNEKLTDSLYYSLYFKTGKEVKEEKLAEIRVNETFYDEAVISELDSIYWSNTNNGINYGVDPASIKALKNVQFQNTLIATKQFEERLKVMFKICRTDIIDIYVRNLDKNLWELDSITASLLDDNVYQEDFHNFASQKWTKVKAPNKNLKLLTSFYEKRLESIKKELTDQRNTAVKANNEKTEDAKKLVVNYKKLLQKREAYRMTGYGFERTTLGWINIDIGIEPKDWEYAPLEFTISNNSTFDRAYAYILYTSMKSLYRLNRENSKTFYVGNENRREMIMPKKEKAVGIAIAYQNDQTFLKVIEFQTNATRELNFELEKSSKKELKDALALLETNLTENSVLEDLRYLEEVYLEEIRQNKLDHEAFVMRQLKAVSSAKDTSYMYFNRFYQIDMQIDSCLNKVKDPKPKFSLQ